MKRSKKDIDAAYEILKKYKGKKIAASINHVSRSGMMRRIEFYAIVKNDIERIGYLIARIGNYSYDVDKGGLRVDGCGMDMVFSVISNINYIMWDRLVKERFPEIDNSFSEEAKIKMKKDNVYRIYDTYFFNANNIRML